MTELVIHLKSDTTYSNKEIIDFQEAVEDALLEIDDDIIPGSVNVERKPENDGPTEEQVREWLENQTDEKLVRLVLEIVKGRDEE